MVSLGLALQAQAEPVLLNRIEAIVNDTIITQGDVLSFTATAVDVLWRTYSTQKDVFEKKAAELRQDGLEQLIEKQLVLAEFQTAGGKLPDSVIDDEIRERIRQQFGDRATLTKTLQAQGVSLENYRQRLREDIIVGYMRQKNVSSAILISPQKLEAYYRTNLTQYKAGDQVKLRMIVLNRPSSTPVEEVRAMAHEVLTQIELGAPFSEMASVYSEGSARRQGGDWEWTDQSGLNKGLADVAFKLEAGQHSVVLGRARDGDFYWIYCYDKGGRITSARKYAETKDPISGSYKQVMLEEKTAGNNARGLDASAPPNEFYIMLVEQKRTARTKSLEEVREEIEKSLVSEERNRLQKKWINRLKAKAFCRYY